MASSPVCWPQSYSPSGRRLPASPTWRLAACLGRAVLDQLGAARQQALVPTERLAHDDPVLRDLERPQIFAVSAPTHFHDGHDALQLTLQFDIPLHDDRVGQKCRAVRTEAQIQ